MSDDEISLILRANPAAALEAIRKAKIAGPRFRAANGWRARKSITGEMVGNVAPRTVARLRTIEPYLTRLEMAEDAALVADGWILVDT